MRGRKDRHSFGGDTGRRDAMCGGPPPAIWSRTRYAMGGRKTRTDGGEDAAGVPRVVPGLARQEATCPRRTPRDPRVKLRGTMLQRGRGWADATLSVKLGAQGWTNAFVPRHPW